MNGEGEGKQEWMEGVSKGRGGEGIGNKRRVKKRRMERVRSQRGIVGGERKGRKRERKGWEKRKRMRKVERKKNRKGKGKCGKNYKQDGREGKG